MTISNKFTLTRIVLAPIFLVLFFLPKWTGNFNGFTGCVMFPLLAFAEFTDFLDGFFARKRGEVSDFGKLFDPFAEVILHLTTFACCLASGYMHPLIFVLILYREFGMSFVRMIAAKKGIAIAARKGGKLKTVLYVVSGFIVVIYESLIRLVPSFVQYEGTFRIASLIAFCVCLLASYVSFIDYLVHFSGTIKK